MRRANREIKDPLELEEILRTCDSCRIAIHAGTFPYIVALNYGYEYQNGALTLYFHSANQGRKLDLLREDPHVGFQMDCDHVFRHLDRGMQCTMDYRSIVGTGTISFVEDRAEFEKATRLLLEHHGSPEGFVVTDAHFKATTILKLTAHSFTDKKKTPFN